MLPQPHESKRKNKHLLYLELCVIKIASLQEDAFTSNFSFLPLTFAVKPLTSKIHCCPYSCLASSGNSLRLQQLECGRQLLQLVLLLVMLVVLLLGLTVTGSTRSKREAETKDGVHLPGWTAAGSRPPRLVL